MNMDIDIDLDDLDFGDKVKDFLEHKLREIKNNNASIKQKINERNKLREILQTEDSSRDKSACSVCFKWKKCFHNKYVLCYLVENNLNKPLENLKPLLEWSSSNHLTYQTIIYDIPNKMRIPECFNDSCENITNSLIKSTCVHSKAYVMVVMNVPRYLDRLEYSISGKMMAKQGSKDVLVDLPDLKISSEDISNRGMCDLSLSSGNIDNILAAIVTSRKTELVLIFPIDWGISLDSTFEIHCSLTKMNISNTCKKYLVAHRLSQAFDDSIIALHNSKSGSRVWTTVYSRSEDALFSILHHLHQHIPGLIIIPRDLYDNYEMKNCTVNEDIPEILEKFQKCINKELDLIESVTQSAEKQDIRKFRSTLVDLEKETDSLYLKICELNNSNNIMST